MCDALLSFYLCCMEQEHRLTYSCDRALWSTPDEVLEESDDEESLVSEGVGEVDLSLVGLDQTGEEPMEQRGAGSEDFNKVVGEMVSTGYAEGHPTDNLLMEIKGFKFAQNKVFIN